MSGSISGLSNTKPIPHCFECCSVSPDVRWHLLTFVYFSSPSPALSPLPLLLLFHCHLIDQAGLCSPGWLQTWDNSPVSALQAWAYRCVRLSNSNLTEKYFSCCFLFVLVVCVFEKKFPYVVQAEVAGTRHHTYLQSSLYRSSPSSGGPSPCSGASHSKALLLS